MMSLFRLNNVSKHKCGSLTAYAQLKFLVVFFFFFQNIRSLQTVSFGDKIKVKTRISNLIAFYLNTVFDVNLT